MRGQLTTAALLITLSTGCEPPKPAAPSTPDMGQETTEEPSTTAEVSWRDLATDALETHKALGGSPDCMGAATPARADRCVYLTDAASQPRKSYLITGAIFDGMTPLQITLKLTEPHEPNDKLLAELGLGAEFIELDAPRRQSARWLATPAGKQTAPWLIEATLTTDDDAPAEVTHVTIHLAPDHPVSRANLDMLGLAAGATYALPRSTSRVTPIEATALFASPETLRIDERVLSANTPPEETSAQLADALDELTRAARSRGRALEPLATLTFARALSLDQLTRLSRDLADNGIGRVGLMTATTETFAGAHPGQVIARHQTRAIELLRWSDNSNPDAPPPSHVRVVLHDTGIDVGVWGQQTGATRWQKPRRCAEQTQHTICANPWLDAARRARDADTARDWSSADTAYAEVSAAYSLHTLRDALEELHRRDDAPSAIVFEARGSAPLELLVSAIDLASTPLADATGCSPRLGQREALDAAKLCSDPSAHGLFETVGLELGVKPSE